MKNITATFILLFISIASLMASNEPKPSTTIFTIEAVSFQMDADQMAAYSLDVIFVEDDNTIRMSAGTDVNFIQVMNAAGELEYQLPIYSQEVIIDLDDFNIGLYQLNLMMKDENMINSSFVKK